MTDDVEFYVCDWKIADDAILFVNEEKESLVINLEYVAYIENFPSSELNIYHGMYRKEKMFVLFFETAVEQEKVFNVIMSTRFKL